jgi:small subunit ribosomal protein S6
MDEVTKVLSTLEETIKNYAGKVLSTDKIGRKKLAYEIKKFRDGFYASLDIELPEAKVADLKRFIKLNDNYLRSMVTIKEAAKALVSGK